MDASYKFPVRAARLGLGALLTASLGFLAYRIGIAHFDISKRFEKSYLRATEINALEKEYARVNSVWTAHTFTRASEDQSLPKLLAEKVSAAFQGTRFSDAQEHRAYEAAQSYFDGYSSDSGSAHLRFRVPSDDFTPDANRVVWARTWLKRYQKPEGEDSSVLNDPKQLYKALWDGDLYRTKSYISQVALDTLAVSVVEEGVPVNAPRQLEEDFSKYLPTVPTLGGQEILPFFQFNSAAATSGQKHDTLVVACLVNRSRGDGPVPMLYKATWSPQLNRWVPKSLAIGSLYGKVLRPLF